MKKIMIAGVSSGVGKTTITLGLLNALKKRGIAVQPYKVGPDYVDTEYHTRITGTASRNLDSFLIPDPDTLRFLFTRHGQDAEIAVIEGVMGLYDGFGIDKDCCSSASIAKQLGCPVILIVNAKSASISVAAIVKGFQDLDPQVTICGVIFNNIASENHYSLVKGAVEKYTNTTVLGCLYKNEMLQLPSRQLGLVPDVEMADILEKVDAISKSLEKTVAIDKIITLAKEETALPEPPQSVLDYSTLTIAYAFDESFHFYYQDNLALLKEWGVTLLPFSPLHDVALPEADLYYFGGGYPEEFAEKLAGNVGMRQAILTKSEQNVCILAECGGLMYLGTALEQGEKQFPMVGIFDGISRMTPRLRKFGYCEGEMLQDTLLGEQGTRLVGHEFHHSTFESTEPTVLDMKKIRDGSIVSQWVGGYQKRNTFASYLHLHFYQHPSLLPQVLNNVLKEREKCM